MRKIGKQMSKIILLALLVILASATAMAQDATQATQVSISGKLRDLNSLTSYTYESWKNSYDSLRNNSVYNWMDWSNDGCFGLDIGYHTDFYHGCLRHDLSWRTLPVIDGATGRIWNERNRYAVDLKFQADNLARCGEANPFNGRTSDGTLLHSVCSIAAQGYYQAVRRLAGYRSSVSSDERTSTTLQSNFIEYPATTTTATVDCSGSNNRCLPINYLKLDGKPFAPQNIVRLPTNASVKIQVVRANHQSVAQPPSISLNRGTHSGRPGNSGELLLRAKYPLRASKSSIIPCPSASDPDPSDVYIDVNGYPLVTIDKALKETNVYLKVCRPITEDEENDALLELLPVRAVYAQSLEPHPADPPYVWQTSIGGRVRHYENLKAGPANCNPTTIPLASSYRGSGFWTSSDCLSALRSGKYADYYTFTLTSKKRVQIDLESSTDTYLYLVTGSVIDLARPTTMTALD